MKTNRSKTLLPLLFGLLAAACQRLDPNLASGKLSGGRGTGGTAGDPSPTGGTGGDGSGGAGVSDCPTVRMQAYDILQTNCAFCHEAPGNPAYYSGGFNFILDLAKLTSSASPQSSTTLTLKYVVKGSPATSYIFRRISENSMPPRDRTQRPTAGDIAVLDEWIANCIDDSTSPEGWGGSTTPADAGVDTGPALDNCGPANVCPNGACCVFNQCRPNGTTCGSLPNPIPGQANLPGLPGICTSGSCQNAAGHSCGKPGEPCCDYQTCTASQSSCLPTDMTMCTACGGAGQPCCKPTNCLDGHACVGAVVGKVGTCQLCGALGQPCCGSGAVALRSCDGALTCVVDAVMGSRCSSGTDGGDGTAGNASATDGGGQ
jgi:hypothetical protein